jgi:hypothetical protein
VSLRFIKVFAESDDVDDVYHESKEDYPLHKGIEVEAKEESNDATCRRQGFIPGIIVLMMYQERKSEDVK